jgi:hypothetical protein
MKLAVFKIVQQDDFSGRNGRCVGNAGEKTTKGTTDNSRSLCQVEKKRKTRID